MALGLTVNKDVLDYKASQAVLEMRSALDKTESIAKWLENQPVVEGADPLVETLGYTTDEAYILRLYFQSVDTIRTNNANLIELGRKMTGLE